MKNDCSKDPCEPYLEVAIQTVLYRYKDDLLKISTDEKLVQEMAAEITVKAKQFKKIVDQNMEKLDGSK
jgi:hypothetical protein